MPERIVIYGLHAVSAALTHGREKPIELWLDAARHDARMQQLAQAARAAGVAIRTVEQAELDKAASGARHQGVLVFCRSQPVYSEDDLPFLLEKLTGPVLLLVLDGVQDPHNLGACLRSADAAGVHAVIVPRDRAAGLTPVARKVASGAAETVPFIQVTNLARTLRGLKDAGLWLIGADGAAAASLYDADLRIPLALILGAEGKGMRRLTREHCDTLVRIPMHGTVQSLNVSVAAAVCLFEAARQRG
ncbi:MAG: 23S rRNA (guanosine(2251)-2'-O)-methyltransferase RlmB [Gammaproteobacteria bacterium]